MRPATKFPLRFFPLALFAGASLFFSPPLVAQKPEVSARITAPSPMITGSKAPLMIEMTLGTKWHVNSHTPSEDFLVPTSVILKASAGKLSLTRYPKHVEKRFPFSEKPLAVYAGTVRFETDLELPADASGKVVVTGYISYQACNDEQCFPPAKIPLEVSLAISEPAGK